MMTLYIEPAAGPFILPNLSEKLISYFPNLSHNFLQFIICVEVPYLKRNGAFLSKLFVDKAPLGKERRKKVSHTTPKKLNIINFKRGTLSSRTCLKG